MPDPEARAPWWRAAVAVCALAPLTGLPCASAYARSDTTIWEGDDQAVTLAPQDDEAAPPNDHPVTLAPQDIERMLSDLRFRFSDADTEEAPQAAVFSREQVEILGEALATGLASATPSQDLIFSVIGAHRLSPGAFARRNRLTAGRVFFREGKLNLIFGEIQSPYRKKNIYGRIEQDFYPRQYGSRATAEEHETILIASAAASLRGDPEGARNDWVVFDPEITGTPQSRRAGATAPDRSEPAPAGSGAAPAPAAPATVAGAAAPEEAAPEAAQRDDIEQRLRTLKDLREKELISEEAYRRKVDEILEEL